MSPRRMKEASVAGESPGKSEQRKSSGTAPEEHDPRLAVFREPVVPAGSGSDNASDGTAGGVTDTGTAVFRLPEVPAEPDASDDARAEHEEAGDDSGKAGSGPQETRDAPEAAVRPEGGPASPEEAATPPDGRPAVARVAGDDEAAGADGAAAVAETGESAAPADEADEADEDDTSDTAGSESGAESDSGSDAASGPASDAAPSEPSDARLRAVVAAWVETAGDSSDGAQAQRVDDDAAQDATPVSDSGSGEPRVPRTREEVATPEDEDARHADTASEEASKPGAKSAVSPADRAEEPEEPEKPEKAEVATGAEAARDKRGIDQPTAVFKAVRLSRVDHPTTALKLPPELPPKPEPKPESPAERTSKFVPLRSDDVRPAPVVGPTVTPTITPKPEFNASGRPDFAGAAGPVSGLTEAERTRQQPLPPRPPLDLLAELTNTPPPPQTPVRTAVRRVKIWTPLLLLVVIVFAIAQAVRPLPAPALELSADPTYTFGGGKLDMPWPAEGQGAVEVEGVGVIGAYGQEKSAPIASIAKVMTAYVILKEHPITGKQTGERIEVDAKAGEEANRPDESTAPIEEGQKYTERQMLQLLMIPSGNNVARLLARWDATTEDAFVDKMNEAAADLGMTKSTYTDPSGLKSSTVSTPADQLKLAKAVMQNDVFREIVNMPQAKVPGIDNMIYNNNSILLEPGVSGIKTGSSTPAGGNLLWAADTVIDGKSRRILGVVMGADLEGTLNEKLDRAKANSLKLIQAAQKGVDSATVVKKGQVVGYVDDGLGGRTPVVSTKDLKAVGWGGLEVELNLDAVAEELAHAAEPGTVVGAVTVGTGTGKVSAPVALQSEMTEPTFGEKLTRIS